MDHAERVPAAESTNEMFHLPIHIVVKESSITTKIRAVFNASTKSFGVSLNSHSSLVGCTITFSRRAYQPNVSSCAVVRFVWHRSSKDHYRMIRATFGVSSSTFIALNRMP